MIQACIANDRTAQEKLYKRFYPQLFLLCRRFLPDERDALEALNDGMLKVYRNLAAYQPGKGSFFNWVYTVVRNTVLDSVAKQHWHPAALEDNTQLASGNPLEKLQQKDIYILLDVLKPATRIVCCLYYLEGFQVLEICQRLGIREGTVKWHLSETRKHLRQIFKTHYND